jgi:hypothetical protein
MHVIRFTRIAVWSRISINRAPRHCDALRSPAFIILSRAVVRHGLAWPGASRRAATDHRSVFAASQQTNIVTVLLG